MNNTHLIRRFAAVAAVALSLGAFAPVGVSLASASGCSFSDGFAALDATIPTTVGGCLGGPSIDSNGNTVQQTTAGMMAYNPKDNVPAFTNGSETWVLGPQGLQTRPNDQRFAYETPEAHVAAAPVAGASASGCSFSDGFAALDATIPTTVGGCLGGPSIDSTGSTVQQTTAGMMAYNPKDNVPAFTNGSETWVLGPQGLQTRPN
ncbi:MAG: hypothetical protein ACYDAG_19275, partial [Chloroflexota bacterium]